MFSILSDGTLDKIHLVASGVSKHGPKACLVCVLNSSYRVLHYFTSRVLAGHFETGSYVDTHRCSCRNWMLLNHHHAANRQQVDESGMTYTSWIGYLLFDKQLEILLVCVHFLCYKL
jgi:hypothetical protein